MPLHDGQLSTKGDCRKLPNVKAATTPQKLADINPDRVGVTVYNFSAGTLYIDFGTTVSLQSFMVAIAPGGYWESPFPCNEALWGIWNRTAGNAIIRDFT